MKSISQSDFQKEHILSNETFNFYIYVLGKNPFMPLPYKKRKKKSIKKLHTFFKGIKTSGFFIRHSRNHTVLPQKLPKSVKRQSRSNICFRVSSPYSIIYQLLSFNFDRNNKFFFF